MMRKTLAIFFLGVLWISAEELGTKPLNIDKTEDATEKSYRQFVGEQEFHLPFKTRLSEGFKEGQTVHAYGRISKDPQRIDFNFHKGSSKNADIPLHLSIRFDEGIFSGKIVYNIQKDGNWSETENRIDSPFKSEGTFDLRVRIVGGKYKVYANRREIGTFDQRESLEGVDHVSISGDLQSLRVFHYGGAIFANPYTAIAKLSPSKRLDVSGMPTGKKFNINLYRADMECALQLSIRYNEGVIVRNSMVNNEWQTEEREGTFPLSKNEVFDITIINQDYSFQIFINGQRFTAYTHKLQGGAEGIETLQIDGAVDLHTVTINDVPK
ncbi:Galectin [Aphelenchoides besseyi]|nr:Galectin [Aphelenchoides besseyi]KAI6194102.1 Galectin [Aphelenchoides besseyi]